MTDESTANFEHHRTRLLETKNDLRRRLDAVQRDVSRPLNADSAEQATELENRDVLLALGDEAKAELAAIERALDRIAAGTYGECARCGESIAIERLNAYPAATLCMRCAEASSG